MDRKYSLATLMLLVAIAAVGLASSRTALSRLAEHLPQILSDVEPPAILVIAVLGAMAGAFYGCWLSLWDRSGVLALILRFFGGACLGAAAATQFTAKTDWFVIFLTPIILVSLTTLVAINRRRTAARLAANH